MRDEAIFTFILGFIAGAVVTLYMVRDHVDKDYEEDKVMRDIMIKARYERYKQDAYFAD